MRKRHLWSIRCALEYARTHLTPVASGFAPTPTSSTRDADGPSNSFARRSAVVVSGQMVVHFGSLKERTTTLPRSDRSETRLPNWSVRLKPGAAPLRCVPGSTAGFIRRGPDEIGSAGAPEEWTIEIAAPMPTPTNNAIPRTR